MIHKIARYLLHICFLIFLLYSCLILSPCYFNFLYKNSSNDKTVCFAIAALYLYIILFFIFLPLDCRTASGIDMMYYITDTIWDSYRARFGALFAFLFPCVLWVSALLNPLLLYLICHKMAIPFSPKFLPFSPRKIYFSYQMPNILRASSSVIF